MVFFLTWFMIRAWFLTLPKPRRCFTPRLSSVNHVLFSLTRHRWMYEGTTRVWPGWPVLPEYTGLLWLSVYSQVLHGPGTMSRRWVMKYLVQVWGVAKFSPNRPNRWNRWNEMDRTKLNRRNIKFRLNKWGFFPSKATLLKSVGISVCACLLYVLALKMASDSDWA